MRVLILNSEYPPIGGGAGNASANIARELAALGQEVCVLTAAFGDLPRDETVSGVRLVRIPALRRKQDRSGALEQAVFIVAASIYILRLIPKFKPNVIFAFFGVPAGAVALFAKLIFKTPYIVSLRGGDVPGFRPYDFKRFHQVIAPLLRVVWKQASAIVANSDGLRLLALAFDSRFAIPIIPNGVDVERFTLPASRDWSEARLLFVGRVVYQKGLDLLLPALVELNYLDSGLTVIGDGPQRAALERLAATLGLAARVHFAGWQRGTDLERHYQNATLFVFPSRHEGMPNAVLEAMASGLPVIATRIAGNEELVIDNETGLLVPTEDIAALKEACEKMISNPNLRERMGVAGRQRVEEHFTWGSVARQYLHLLESASKVS